MTVENKKIYNSRTNFDFMLEDILEIEVRYKNVPVEESQSCNFVVIKSKNYVPMKEKCVFFDSSYLHDIITFICVAKANSSWINVAIRGLNINLCTAFIAGSGTSSVIP